MIRRINKLKNVGRYTDLRSGSGNPHALEQVNIIDASHGSGKTTLGDLLDGRGQTLMSVVRSTSWSKSVRLKIAKNRRSEWTEKGGKP